MPLDLKTTFSSCYLVGKEIKCSGKKKKRKNKEGEKRKNQTTGKGGFWRGCTVLFSSCSCWHSTDSKKYTSLLQRKGRRNSWGSVKQTLDKVNSAVKIKESIYLWYSFSYRDLLNKRFKFWSPHRGTMGKSSEAESLGPGSKRFYAMAIYLAIMKSGLMKSVWNQNLASTFINVNGNYRTQYFRVYVFDLTVKPKPINSVWTLFKICISSSKQILYSVWLFTELPK